MADKNSIQFYDFVVGWREKRDRWKPLTCARKVRFRGRNVAVRLCLHERPTPGTCTQLRGYILLAHGLMNRFKNTSWTHPSAVVILIKLPTADRIKRARVYRGTRDRVRSFVVGRGGGVAGGIVSRGNGDTQPCRDGWTEGGKIASGKTV